MSLDALELLICALLIVWIACAFVLAAFRRTWLWIVSLVAFAPVTLFMLIAITRAEPESGEQVFIDPLIVPLGLLLWGAVFVASFAVLLISKHIARRKTRELK